MQETAGRLGRLAAFRGLSGAFVCKGGLGSFFGDVVGRGVAWDPPTSVSVVVNLLGSILLRGLGLVRVFVGGLGLAGIGIVEGVGLLLKAEGVWCPCLSPVVVFS